MWNPGFTVPWWISHNLPNTAYDGYVLIASWSSMVSFTSGVCIVGQALSCYVGGGWSWKLWNPGFTVIWRKLLCMTSTIHIAAKLPLGPNLAAELHEPATWNPTLKEQALTIKTTLSEFTKKRKPRFHRWAGPKKETLILLIGKAIKQETPISQMSWTQEGNPDFADRKGHQAGNPDFTDGLDPRRKPRFHG